jgi:hypothetical protein
MTNEEALLLGAQRLFLKETERLHPAEDAMRGIDIRRRGTTAKADRALVAAFLAARERD